MDAAFVDAGNGLVSTEFSVTVRNTGGAGSAPSVPVQMKIDEDEPETVGAIDRPASGDAVSLAVTRKLPPGQHVVLFEVGESVRSIVVDVKTADITLEPLRHAIRESGSIELSVKVTNQGGISAEAVAVSAYWMPSPDDTTGAPSGRTGVPTLIDVLGPGESQVAVLPVDIPTGSYTFTLSADTETIEALQDDNTAETTVEVDYVQLVSTVKSTSSVGYESDGDGIVEVSLIVANEGVAPSGPIRVGLTCPGEALEGCSQDLDVGSIFPGDDTTVLITLTLPQGETPVLVFAGAPDDGYRWGDANVQRPTIVVAHKPEVSLVLDAHTNVSGYWSDGTANVELTASLRNDGYLEVEDAQRITITCQRDGETLSDCGEEVEIDLADGFGPAESAITLRVPMGSSLEVNIGVEGHETVQVHVPERILGVDRYVWECFSDRPGVHARDEGKLEGCGGWFQETIEKWDLDRPVRVWATGRSDYIAVLNTVIEEMSPLLNLEFELVESKETADVYAYVGVPASTSFDLGWGERCEEAAGCASWRVDNGVVRRGTFSAWYRGDLAEHYRTVKGVIIHELLHVMVPIGHRHTLDVLVGGEARLSLIEEDLIRLNSHPLVEPGMTMREVKELIVLNDELLDPPAPARATYQMVRRAADALLEAGSARFRVRGAWQKHGCGNPKFGWANYEIAEFDPDGSTRWVRFQYRDEHYAIVDKDVYWRETEGAWIRLSRSEIFGATAWHHGYTNPFTALKAILTRDEGAIEVSDRSNGQIIVETPAPLSDWVVNIYLVLNEDNYQISGYGMTFGFAGTCLLKIEAIDGEYGVDIDVPHAIERWRMSRSS